MIQIYKKTLDKIDVDKNGIIIDPITCEISNTLNGENELELEYPLMDDKYIFIKNDNYIAVTTPDFDEPQLYKIYNTKKNMDTITAYARHIIFDLSKKIVFNKSVVGNAQTILNRLLEDTNFIGATDIASNASVQYKLQSVMNCIKGSEGSFCDSFNGGEILCNNYRLTINREIGTDRGIRVSFGYNLEDIEEELNFDGVVTRIYPSAGDIVLSNYCVDSTLINTIGVIEDTINFDDIKVRDEETADSDDITLFDTIEQAQVEMIKRCNKLFNAGLDKIVANYVVKMQDLSKTIEYKQLGYDVLEKICLGDTVHCYNSDIGIEVDARCISYKWDCISEEYIEIELGDYKGSYVSDNNSRIENLYKQIELQEQKILLQVDSLNNNFTSKLEITANQITQQVTYVKNDLQGQLNVQANKINAVVTEKDEGMGWELSKNAFKVACQGASDTNVVIDQSGLVVNDGKFKLKNDGSTVFKVNTSGMCQADGGFVVEDNDTSCEIGSKGITLTGENGSEAKIQILDDGQYSGTYIRDDLYVEDVLRVFGKAKFEGGISVDGEDLEDMILRIIEENK